MGVNFDYMKANRVLAKKINEELQNVSSSVDDNGTWAYTKLVEKIFAKYVGTKNAFFFDSGTTAVQIALKLAGLKKGQRVILPVACYPSIVLSVLYAGGVPEFVDIKEDFTIDETKIEELKLENANAIIPVHLFGHACEMNQIMKISEKHELAVIEDACQAHGSTYDGKMLGSIGHFNAFSFTFHKTISTIGGGGAITFNDISKEKEIENMVTIENDHPSVIESLRAPGRMSLADIGVLKVKLQYHKLLEDNKKTIKSLYEKNLENIEGIEIVKDINGSDSVRQMYVAYFDRRDELISFLKKEGIVAKMPYVPLDKFKIFRKYVTGIYPCSDRYQKNALFLPMFPLMRKEDVEEVCEAIKKFYGDGS